jgi:hypothetical protein
MHLIDKHMFPKDYDFFIVNDGIDQRSSMLRSGRHRRRSSAVQYKNDIDERARRRLSNLGDTEGKTIENAAMPIVKDAGESKLQNNATVTPITTPKDTDMEGLVGAMSSLKFVPPSVRFGRGRGKGGFSRS